MYDLALTTSLVKNSESINHVMPATPTLRGCVKTKEMSQKEEVPAILADKVL